MEQGTRTNLEEAMKGEGFAFAKYMLYAERAREEGMVETADLFERIALEERLEHFRELAELYGLVGDTEENLQAAAEGETTEVVHTYRLMSEAAQAVGDKLVADRFEEIRHDEMRHEELFREELSRIMTMPPPDEIEIDLAIPADDLANDLPALRIEWVLPQ